MSTTTFIASVDHADGYNGHRATAYVVFDDKECCALAVYPHGWHHAEHHISMRACDIADGRESSARTLAAIG